MRRWLADVLRMAANLLDPQKAIVIHRTLDARALAQELARYTARRNGLN